MILELAQLLSTSHHILDKVQAEVYYNQGKIYKKTHYNHPCALWVREHINNYNYVCRLGLELCKEWRYRYNHPETKLHGAELKLIFLLENPPRTISLYNIKKTEKNPRRFTLPMPLAMPDQFKILGKNPKKCIKSYRRYYLSSQKEHLRSWTTFNTETKQRENIEKPHWFHD